MQLATASLLLLLLAGAPAPAKQEPFRSLVPFPADKPLPQSCNPRPPSEAKKYEPLVDKALAATADVYPVPKALVFAVMRQESRFDPYAVSTVGARGLMQLMWYNAKKVGIDPDYLFDPATNILAGTRLLAGLLAYYKGDIISALVAYNSRPREAFTPIPQNGETPEYCVKVLEFYNDFLKTYPTPPATPQQPPPAQASRPMNPPRSAGANTTPPPPQPPAEPRAIHFTPSKP